jgi:hypothetical protein
MKTLLELIKENRNINECGGSSVYVGGGCGPGRWISRSEYDAMMHKERQEQLRSKLSKIDPEIVKEYKQLAKKRNRIIDSKDDYVHTQYVLTNELSELKFNTLGIQNVYSDITDIFRLKPSLYRTCTITVDVLKILSYLLSEEYNEANMDDPQLQDAFTKILEKL